jgi:hypothetical protein
MRVAESLLAVHLALCAMACSAVPPTAPTNVPLSSLRIFYEFPWGPTSAGVFFPVRAYAVNADGVYTDVTDLAQWSTSNPAVLRFDPFFASKMVAGVSPGTADVIASHQNLSASLNVVYGGFPQPLPRIEFSSGAPREVGTTSTVFAALRSENAFAVISDNPGVVWTSSNPEIATVNGGRVTAIAVGTVQINATFAGVSGWYRFSVFPRRFGNAKP